MSSLCRGHANLLCIVPTLSMSPRRGQEYVINSANGDLNQVPCSGTVSYRQDVVGTEIVFIGSVKCMYSKFVAMFRLFHSTSMESHLTNEGGAWRALFIPPLRGSVCVS